MSPTQRIRVSCAVALFAAHCGAAAAQAPPAPGAAVQLYPGTREYRWTFYVPVLSFERYEIVVQELAPTIRARRWEYEAPGLRSERYKLWQAAEFRCKYHDWWRLPNECGVYWHDVYADLPQLTMQRNHLDYEDAEWRWRERRVRFNVPRWTWTEQILRVMVPVPSDEKTAPPEWSEADIVRLAREPIDRAQARIAALEADTARTLDAALSALEDRTRQAIAEGADPRRLIRVDGATIDLAALKSALLDDKARELGRLERMRAELEAALPGLVCGAR